MKSQIVDGLPVDYSKLPECARHSVRLYIEEGLPPGHFLTSVASNDLFAACARGDKEAKEALSEIVSWFYNHAPSQCYGSHEKVVAWLDRKESK